jgi:hypothetical protein
VISISQFEPVSFRKIVIHYFFSLPRASILCTLLARDIFLSRVLCSPVTLAAGPMPPPMEVAGDEMDGETGPRSGQLVAVKVMDVRGRSKASASSTTGCPGALHEAAPPPDDASLRAHAQRVAAGCAVIVMNGEDIAVKSPDDDDAFTTASTPAPSTSSERKKPKRRAREWWREEYDGCGMDSASLLHFPFPATSLGSPLCFFLLTKR